MEFLNSVVTFLSRQSPRVKILMAIGATIALLGLIYLLWGFLLAFITLSLVYATIALGVIWLISRNWGVARSRRETQVNAIYAEADRIRSSGTANNRRAANEVEVRARPLEQELEALRTRQATARRKATFGENISNNNTWFFVLTGATLLTLVIALFNWGPAILLPENLPTLAVRNTGVNTINYLFYGNSEKTFLSPSEGSLPWATGTWFWWKAFFLYLVVTFGYFWYAFSDEFAAGIRRITQMIQERRAEAIAERRAAHAAAVAQINAQNAANRGKKGYVNAQPLPPPPARMGFWEFAKWDFIMELITEGARAFMTSRRSRRA